MNRIKYLLNITATVLLFSLFTNTPLFAGFNTDNVLPEDYINIGIPEDMLVLDDGSIWYVDSQNFRVVKVDQDGEVLRQVGREGSEEGEFECPLSGITTDEDGYLYVLSDCKVYVLDFNGGVVDKWGEQGADEIWQFSTPKGIKYNPVTESLYITDVNHDRILSFDKDGTYNFSFGTIGSGATHIDGPRGLDIDSSGNLYIADEENHRVQVFNSSGVHIRSIGSSSIFEFPKDVEILANGNIAVSSQNNQKIYIFDEDGNVLDSWGEYGDDDHHFHYPQYLASDSSNNVYVSDWDLKSIQKFTEGGSSVWTIRNAGITNGTFTYPTSIAYDSDDNLYVLDNGANSPRIQKFTNSGTFIETFAGPDDLGLGVYHMYIDGDDKVYVTHGGGFTVFNSDGTVLLDIGSGGTGNGEFDNARGISTDSLGNIYVVDWGNHRVQKFDSDGLYLDQWGEEGQDAGNFDGPESLMIDSSNNVYVVDNFHVHGSFETPNTRIQVFDTDGDFVETIGQFGEEVGDFSPVLGGLVRDSAGHLWVVDQQRNKVMEFDENYDYVGEFGSLGGGITEFDSPFGIAINPFNDTLAVADTNNHRVQGIGEGVRIFNLTPSADVVRVDSELSLVTQYYDPAEEGIDDLDSVMYFGDYIVTDFTVDLTEDRDWTSVNAVTLPTMSVSLLQNLNPESAPGISETHSIYVAKSESQLGVYVCPEAVTLEDIGFDCADGYPLYLGDDGLTVETVDDIEYWRVDNLTGTGAMGIEEVDSFYVVPSSLSVELGETISLSVTAVDSMGGVVSLYDGEVEVTSDGFDSTTEYQFVSEDDGSYTFVDAFSFNTPGTYTITVEDTEDSDIFGVSAEIVVASLEEDEDTDEGEEDEDTGIPEIDNASNLGGSGGGSSYQDFLDSLLDSDELEEDSEEEGEDTDEETDNNRSGGGVPVEEDEDNNLDDSDNSGSTMSIAWKVLGWGGGISLLLLILFRLLVKRTAESY